MSLSSSFRPRRLRPFLTVGAAAAVMSLSCFGNLLAAGLAELQAVPERGQSVEQARRDRYECHNWAVEQTGAAPTRAGLDPRRDDAKAERVDKILLGTAVGAVLGGLIRGSDGQRGDAADGALGGAVLGAAAGAIAGRRGQGAQEIEDPDSDYVRALGACLEGRGYVLVDRAQPEA
jgi:hypothetical protein